MRNSSTTRKASFNKTRASLAAIFMCGFVLLISGCTSPHVARTATNLAPSMDAGQAQIIFMRPSSYGGAIQSSVYEVRNDTEELVGIVSAKSKVAHNVPSGEHLFMVVSEGADFMSATVEAGKTYYVLVAPRVGFWKARFSLIPIHNDPAEKYNINGPEFAGWNSSTQFVELKDSGREWYRQNAADIARKRKNHLARWNALSAENKAQKILYAKDGVEQKTPE